MQVACLCGNVVNQVAHGLWAAFLCACLLDGLDEIGSGLRVCDSIPATRTRQPGNADDLMQMHVLERSSQQPALISQYTSHGGSAKMYDLSGDRAGIYRQGWHELAMHSGAA